VQYITTDVVTAALSGAARPAAFQNFKWPSPAQRPEARPAAPPTRLV
jgi:hypothetical protein